MSLHTFKAVRHALLSASLVMLASCASVSHIRRNDAAVDQSAVQAEQQIQQLRATKPLTADMQVDATAATVIDKPYVNTTPVSTAHALPAPCNITFKTAGPRTLLDAAQQISRWCHFQVRVTPDALQDDSSTDTSGTTGPAPTPGGVQSLPPLPGQALTRGLGASYGVSSVDGLSDVNYTGNAAGLLDLITSRFGLSWRVERGAVVIFLTETRMFRIYNLPQTLEASQVISSGNTTVAGATGGSQSGASSSGTSGVSGSTGSTQTATLGLHFDPGKDLVSAVQAMVSPSRVKQVFYAASTNRLVVTDTPEVLDRVQAYVDDLNKTYSQQVLVNAKVLTVTVDDSDSYGLNWNAVYTNLANKYNIKLSSSYTMPSGAVSGAVNILGGNPHWNGSQAFINALSTQGRVRVLTEPSVLARNLKPTPMQVATQTSYVQQNGTTITSGASSGFAQSQKIVGQITTGFNMMLIPSIYPDNKNLELQLNINLSDLVSLLPDDTGGSTVQLPTVENKMFSHDVDLQTGDTVVLAAFKQDKADNKRSGVGSAANFLFGGGLTGNHSTTYVVIVITPVILRDNVPPSVSSAY